MIDQLKKLIRLRDLQSPSMTGKKMIIVLIISITSFVFLISCLAPAKRSSSAVSSALGSPSSEEQTHSNKVVTVYYFHGAPRCPMCMKIEALSKTAVQSLFPDELQQGILTMKIVNIDEPENARFNELFSLVRPSLIVALYQSEEIVQWKNLDKIWELCNQELLFNEYLRDEIVKLLNN